MKSSASLNIRGEEPGTMEPKYLGDWTAQVPDDADAVATIKWVGKNGPGRAELPAWVLNRLRATGGGK